jgi:uncharacterized membrane protein YphA (DoxX/SURF4 family)
MKRFRTWLFLMVFMFMAFYTLPVTFAHEQYVLTQHQFNNDMADKTISVWSALHTPENIFIAVSVGSGVLILLFLTFFFQHSVWGRKLGDLLDLFDSLGHLLLRVALAASLLASAYFHAFMGPEIPINSLPLQSIILPLLYFCGILLLFGVLTRLAALLGLFLLLLTTVVYGDYIITYLNYYGEYIALLVWGSYAFSVDNTFFGISRYVKKYRDIELLIIRVTYGISVMYPALTIKFLHPEVIVDIATRYHLTQIHWLFPSDPLLISLGTGMAQVLVGVMIVVGFQTRLASVITFFLYALSVVYFKEAVWPHYILLTLALYLVINNGGKLTVDEYFWQRFFRKKKSAKKRT